MIRTAKKFYTPEEYLAFERASLEKHEYYQEEIFDMAGAGFNHNKIQKNFLIEVGGFLKRKSCDVFGSNLRIHIPSNTLFTYPDAAIICGEIQSLDRTFDVALNPAVIIEILSPSTQSYDRDEKFMLYRSVKNLQEYILIDSLSVKVEHHIRQSDDSWLKKEYDSLSDTFLIQSIQYPFPMIELYNGVSF